MLTTLEEDFRKLGLDPALVLGESSGIHTAEDIKEMNVLKIADLVRKNEIKWREVEGALEGDDQKIDRIGDILHKWEMSESYDAGHDELEEEGEDYSWVENPDYIQDYKQAADSIGTADTETLGKSYGKLCRNHQRAIGDRWSKTHGNRSWARTFESVNRMTEFRESNYKKNEMREDQETIAQELSTLYSPSELRAFAVKHNLEIDPDAHDAYQMKYSLRKAIKEMGENMVQESKETLEEGLKKKKLKKMKASERGKARRQYRKNKSKIKRKLKKLKAKPKYKRKKEKLKRLKKGRDAGARKKFVLEGVEIFNQEALVESSENFAESMEKFQAVLAEANELASTKEYVKVGDTLKPMNIDIDAEPIDKHVGDTLNSPDEEGDALEKAGVADKYSHKHIGENDDSHVYFYTEMDADTASQAVEMADIKPKKKGDDVLVFGNQDEANKAKEIIREKQINIDEDRELVRLFQNAVYSESFDLKIGNLMEDANQVTELFRKGEMSQSDAAKVVKSMQSYLAGAIKGLHDAVSKFDVNYVGQDDIEEDGTAPEKAETKPHVGEKIEHEPGKPVDAEKNIKHVGDKIDEKSGKVEKPKVKTQHMDSKAKEPMKAEGEPTKAENKPHTGDMPYGEKGTEVPVQSGLKTESVEDSLQGKEISSGVEQFAASDIESKIGRRPKAGDKFFHDGFNWKVVKVDNVGNVDAMVESKQNIQESKKDLMDLAKENSDNREDWVASTVSAGIFYAMGRAPTEMYQELLNSPDLYYTANEKIRNGEIKGNPCDVADWLKEQSREAGVEADFQSPMDMGEPSEPAGDEQPPVPVEPIEDEKKK